jgi:hypothetical protein
MGRLFPYQLVHAGASAPESELWGVGFHAIHHRRRPGTGLGHPLCSTVSLNVAALTFPNLYEAIKGGFFCPIQIPSSKIPRV